MNREESQAQPGGASGVIIEDVAPLTVHDEALLEAGKHMLVEAVSVGREFCKYLIGTSTGSIPFYLAMVKFVLPEKYVMKPAETMLLLFPCLLFLAAAVVAIAGYLPLRRKMSMESLTEVENERDRNINRRRNHGIASTAIWLAGLLFAVVVLTDLMSKGVQG